MEAGVSVFLKYNLFMKQIRVKKKTIVRLKKFIKKLEKLKNENERTNN